MLKHDFTTVKLVKYEHGYSKISDITKFFVVSGKILTNLCKILRL